MFNNLLELLHRGQVNYLMIPGKWEAYKHWKNKILTVSDKDSFMVCTVNMKVEEVLESCSL